MIGVTDAIPFLRSLIMSQSWIYIVLAVVIPFPLPVEFRIVSHLAVAFGGAASSTNSSLRNKPACDLSPGETGGKKYGYAQFLPSPLFAHPVQNVSKYLKICSL